MSPVSGSSSVNVAFSFQILAKNGSARRGEIKTPRGTIRTPAFMPVGTAATVKSMFPDSVHAAGADIVLANTYHLMLRPGAERIARLGGLHRFMHWPYPILTDSGGYQVMSLSALRKIDNKGVTFRSHLDGTMFELTPERAIEIQNLLDADIVMQLDECIKLPAPDSEVERAMKLSLHWAERSRRAFEGAAPGRALFGILQGGTSPTLRKQSARELLSMNFSGYAIGGLAVGEPQNVMLAIIDETISELPADKPRYLMGVGEPDDLLAAVESGIDMFDCVLPTRAGRHSLAYTRLGKVNLKNARHAEDPRPLDEQSQCPAARDYSRAYLHHLVKANEMLGAMLLTWANIAYYQELMEGIRVAISAGCLPEFAAATRESWEKEAR
jgi:queuine tRNA-ribosyltransferase